MLRPLALRRQRLTTTRRTSATGPWAGSTIPAMGTLFDDAREEMNRGKRQKM
jgi:hypothetical protein